MPPGAHALYVLGYLRVRASRVLYVPRTYPRTVWCIPNPNLHPTPYPNPNPNPNPNQVTLEELRSYLASLRSGEREPVQITRRHSPPPPERR